MTVHYCTAEGSRNAHRWTDSQPRTYPIPPPISDSLEALNADVRTCPDHMVPPGANAPDPADQNP